MNIGDVDVLYCPGCFEKGHSILNRADIHFEWFDYQLLYYRTSLW